MNAIVRAAVTEKITEVVMRELFDDETLEADTERMIRRRVVTKVGAVLRAFA
jgi:hypothetical protein